MARNTLLLVRSRPWAATTSQRLRFMVRRLFLVGAEIARPTRLRQARDGIQARIGSANTSAFRYWRHALQASGGNVIDSYSIGSPDYPNRRNASGRFGRTAGVSHALADVGFLGCCGRSLCLIQG